LLIVVVISINVTFNQVLLGSSPRRHSCVCNSGKIITNQVVFQWKVERIKLRQNIY